jgi:integrase/recombinase XerD
MLMFKTVIRRGELASLDVDDVDLEGLTVTLKPARKRSNRAVFFDEEAKTVLARWLKARDTRIKQPGEKALFVGYHGGRLKALGVDCLV